MDIKVFSQYKNIFIGLAIIIIIAIIAQSVFSHYSLEKEKIASKMQELKEGERTIKRWQKLSLDDEELNKSFLAKDTLFFKKFVEEKANNFGIKITALKTTNIEKDLYWETIMKLGMACSYRELVDFIKAIEEKSVVLQKIKIVSGKDVRDERVDLTLKGFIIK